ncbi:MAG TPA: hypothetical protein PLL20_19410 [Phycisphaerae bacterium]|nr:hypothetical protein [Phycisphaerae bacterium]
MNADERRGLDCSGLDLDIWGDGRATNSTPIPEEWELVHPRDTEETIP